MQLTGKHFAAQLRATHTADVVQVQVEVESITPPSPPLRLTGQETAPMVLLVPSTTVYGQVASYLNKLKDQDIPLTAVAHLDNHGMPTRGYDTRTGGRLSLGPERALDGAQLFRAAANSRLLGTQTPFGSRTAHITVLWTSLPTVTEDSDSWHLMKQSFAPFVNLAEECLPDSVICYTQEKDQPAPWATSTNLTLNNDPYYAEDMRSTLAWLDQEMEREHDEHWTRKLAALLRTEPHPRLLLAAMFCRADGWALRAVPSVKGLLQTQYGGLPPLAAPAPPVELDLWLTDWPTDWARSPPLYGMAPTEPGTARMASGFGGPVRLRFTVTRTGSSTLFLWGGTGKSPDLRVIADMTERAALSTEVPVTPAAPAISSKLLETLQLVREECMPALASMTEHGQAFRAAPTDAALQKQAFGAYQTLLGHLRQLTDPAQQQHVLLQQVQTWFVKHLHQHQTVLVPATLQAPPAPKRLRPLLYPGAQHVSRPMLHAPSIGPASSLWGQ